MQAKVSIITWANVKQLKIHATSYKSEERKWNKLQNIWKDSDQTFFKFD